MDLVGLGDDPRMATFEGRMAEISMQQNVNILIQSLSRTFPNSKMTITSIGPVSIVDGKLSIGSATKTEIALGDVSRKELPAPTAALQADKLHAEMTSLNRQAGRAKAKRSKKRLP